MLVRRPPCGVLCAQELLRVKLLRVLVFRVLRVFRVRVIVAK